MCTSIHTYMFTRVFAIRSCVWILELSECIRLSNYFTSSLSFPSLSTFFRLSLSPFFLSSYILSLSSQSLYPFPSFTASPFRPPTSHPSFYPCPFLSLLLNPTAYLFLSFSLPSYLHFATLPSHSTAQLYSTLLYSTCPSSTLL